MFACQVALTNDESSPFILGANMVYSIARLDSMYAPSMIGQVLDFVLPCYAAARPPISGNSETRSLVSTLRPSSSVQVNEALIERTTELIKESSPIGSYHLVWENRDVMVRLVYISIVSLSLLYS